MTTSSQSKCVHCGRELSVTERRFNPWLCDWECKKACESMLRWYNDHTTTFDGTTYLNTDKALTQKPIDTK